MLPVEIYYSSSFQSSWIKCYTLCLSSQSRPDVATFGCQRTSECRKGSFMISWKISAKSCKNLLFKTTSSLNRQLWQIQLNIQILTTNACLWMTQRVPVIACFLSSTKAAMNPERQSSITRVPSVQTPSRFYIKGLFFFKRSKTVARISEAFDAVLSAFENRIYSSTAQSSTSKQ
jgi:hypothetical protein